ncbi:hypothetical protein LTR15_010024 [Elasticomyces elasticus]|nr:hypothetical protein LTR15_010024 [Elasticomyces elasticus]
MPSFSMNAIFAIAIYTAASLAQSGPCPSTSICMLTTFQIFSDRACQSQIGENIVFIWDNALAAGRQELVDLGPFQSIQFFEGDEAQPGGFIACREGFDCFTDGQNAPIAQDVFECSVLTGDQFDKIGVVPDGDA